jgi:hypothetical protein
MQLICLEKVCLRFWICSYCEQTSTYRVLRAEAAGQTVIRPQLESPGEMSVHASAALEEAAVAMHLPRFARVVFTAYF